jgi:hypothetical protein
VKFREHIVEYTNLHYDKRHHPQFDTWVQQMDICCFHCITHKKAPTY